MRQNPHMSYDWFSGFLGNFERSAYKGADSNSQGIKN